MLIHLKPLMLSPIIIIIALCELPVTSSHKTLFQKYLNPWKHWLTLSIFLLGTGSKRRERERRRESIRERKRERYPARVHSCTVSHCSFQPFVNSFLRSPIHMPHIPVSFGNFWCALPCISRLAYIPFSHFLLMCLSLLGCFSQLISHNKGHVLFVIKT